MIIFWIMNISYVFRWYLGVKEIRIKWLFVFGGRGVFLGDVVVYFLVFVSYFGRDSGIY